MMPAGNAECKNVAALCVMQTRYARQRQAASRRTWAWAAAGGGARLPAAGLMVAFVGFIVGLTGFREGLREGVREGLCEGLRDGFREGLRDGFRAGL